MIGRSICKSRRWYTSGVYGGAWRLTSRSERLKTGPSVRSCFGPGAGKGVEERTVVIKKSWPPRITRLGEQIDCIRRLFAWRTGGIFATGNVGKDSVASVALVLSIGA